MAVCADVAAIVVEKFVDHGHGGRA
jgi:hypothetical protein